MKVAEIFAGVEGEGSRIGTPQIFIRTQGCSIQCKWCDTAYTWAKDGECKFLSPNELIAVFLLAQSCTSRHSFSLELIEKD